MSLTSEQLLFRQKQTDIPPDVFNEGAPDTFCDEEGASEGGLWDDLDRGTRWPFWPSSSDATLTRTRGVRQLKWGRTSETPEDMAPHQILQNPGQTQI